MAKSIKPIIEDSINTYIQSGKFTSVEVNLSESDKELFVEFWKDPKRFSPEIFEGNWARPERKPDLGSIRLLRIITGNDGVTRIIARQGNRIFASPWI